MCYSKKEFKTCNWKQYKIKMKITFKINISKEFELIISTIDQDGKESCFRSNTMYFIQQKYNKSFSE